MKLLEAEEEVLLKRIIKAYKSDLKRLICAVPSGMPLLNPLSIHPRWRSALPRIPGNDRRRRIPRLH